MKKENKTTLLPSNNIESVSCAGAMANDRLYELFTFRRQDEALKCLVEEIDF